MDLHQTIESLRDARKKYDRVAFVPTMGNLHAGHLALMRQAREYADCVIVSVFVNRLQFGPHEDFERYPRTLEQDCTQLIQVGVDHLFVPTESVLYPQPQSYFISPPAELDSVVEGAFRPGHFRGVATVVAKLFNIVQPNFALFGKKDYQQLMLIRNMVHELALPIAIIGVETLRASDGLALSSRNSYLSAEERAEAPRLFKILQAIKASVVEGNTDYSNLTAAACEALKAHGWRPDYVSICRQDNLLPAQKEGARVIVAAAYLGSTRLIDNLEID